VTISRLHVVARFIDGKASVVADADTCLGSAPWR